ncbi:MAG: EAL domain-containing protein [Desulfovermiculus sp.]|nr:EAL domain-containing protein [Desulfovermiculus sp.]
MDINLSPYQQSDLFDAVTDLMAVLDLELRIQWANRAAGESVGEDPENLLGRYCYQVWLGRDTPCEQCPVQSTIRTGMQHNGEVESPDGKVFLIKSYPMRTPEGELKGIAEVALDITEYRRAEESLCRQSKEQALLLESVPTQIWYLTDVKTYGAVNQARADFCGLSREEMEYKKLWNFLSEDEARICRDSNIRVFQSGERIHTEEWLHNASGEQRLVEIIKTPKLDTSGKVEYVVCSGSDITESKRTEEALRKKSWELEERVKELDCLYRLSRLLEQPGISRQDLMQSAVELIPPAWQNPDMACARLLLDGEAFYSRDFRETAWKQSADIVVNGNNAGRIEVFYLREAPVCVEGPFLREERELIENIAKSLGHYLERDQAREVLRRSENYYRAIFESSGTAMFIIEHDTTISLVNSNFERLSGYSREEVEGMMSWTEFIHPEDVVWMKEYHYLRRRDPGAAPRHYECCFIDRYGQKRHLFLSVDMIPETSQSIASGVDITERKRAEEKVYSLTKFDNLTGLPNREFFLELLGQAVSRSKRFDECGAVLLVNIERLKSVNDTLGEQAGNELIREVGRRIWGALREQDTVARVSGDEFMILAEGIDSGENALKLGLRVLERIGGELELARRRIYPEASIGFTLFPHGATDPDSLIKQADMALSEAKKSGNRIQQFSGDEEGISREFHLEQDLKSALANEEFRLCYQPQIDLQSGKIVGLEALIRWSHPQRGLVSPGEFIPLLERSGMIVSVDAWVVRKVCEQLRFWRDEGFMLRTSVNLSARDLENDSIIGVISSALEENRLPADALGVEITETELMENVVQASGILRTLSGWGIRVALDDFGKGYSSLSYLQRLDIHVIKIDKEFVAGMLENADSLTLVQTIIAMAHNLGKEVLAEGVEREEQRQKLCEMGCEYGQGFLWGRPQPAESLLLMDS